MSTGIFCEDFMAEIGQHHPCDSDHGSLVMTLPSLGVPDASEVTFNDVGSTGFSKNTFTVASSSKIANSPNDIVVTDNYGKFTYDQANDNWVYAELTLGGE